MQLQEVQPPEEVRRAFDDVVAAAQDASRAVNEAEGYRNEVLPKARGEAAEIVARASGYRDAKIAESTGEAERFLAIEHGVPQGARRHPASASTSRPWRPSCRRWTR